MANVLMTDFQAYKGDIGTRLFHLEAGMNAKFAELERKAVEQENQSMKFLAQAETIKATQAAAQQNLISSIEGEMDKSNKTVALMQTTSNQTLEDIKK